jgi:hypothetical protein
MREPRRAVVIVPLRSGTRTWVHGLLELGRPFDPESAGLGRHQVFFTDQEAVFVFEAPDRSVLDRMAKSPRLRWAAAVWRNYVGGHTRLADVAYAWARNVSGEEAGPQRT